MSASKITIDLPERVTLTAVKRFNTGCDMSTGYTANVLLDGKKVAVAANAGYGDDDTFEILNESAFAEVREIADDFCSEQEQPLDHFLYMLRVEKDILKDAKRDATKHGLPVSIVFYADGELLGSAGIVSELQVDEVLSTVPDATHYRILSSDFKAIIHDTLDSFCAAYPRAVRPPVFTAGPGATSLVFVASGEQHTFTDETHNSERPRLFVQFQNGMKAQRTA